MTPLNVLVGIFIFSRYFFIFAHTFQGYSELYHTYRILLKQRPTDEEHALQVTAVILSWLIYGASVEWRRNSKQIPPEEFIKSAMPYITSGIDFGSTNKQI